MDDSTIDSVEALVESEVNVNNLQRLARSLKLQFHSVAEGNCFQGNPATGRNRRTRGIACLKDG